MKLCSECKKYYSRDLTHCPVHKIELKYEKYFVGDRMSGVFEAVSAETVTAPVRRSGVYTGDITHLKGLEIERSENRIFFKDDTGSRELGNGFAILILVRVGFELPKILQDLQKDISRLPTIVFLVAIFAFVILILLAFYSAKGFFIIDLKENFCCYSRNMSKAPLVKLQKSSNIIGKDDIFGVTINYEKSKYTTAILSAPVLLRKDGLIPLTAYKKGDDYAERADATAKIVSQLWNLPYYKCPKNSEAIPRVLPGDIFDCLFEELE